MDAAAQPVADFFSPNLTQLGRQLVAGKREHSLGEKEPASECGQSSPHVFLGSITVFNREDSFGERSERIGSLELALRVGPKSLTENLGVGVPENPIRVMQYAAKTHGPLNKIVAFGEASTEAIERVGDKIHFSRKATQVRTRPDEMKIEIADRRAVPSRSRTSEGNGRRPYVYRATKHLRRDRLQRIGLKEERPLSIVAKTLLPAELLAEVTHRTTPPLPQ